MGMVGWGNGIQHIERPRVGAFPLDSALRMTCKNNCRGRSTLPAHASLQHVPRPHLQVRLRVHRIESDSVVAVRSTRGRVRRGSDVRFHLGHHEVPLSLLPHKVHGFEGDTFICPAAPGYTIAETRKLYTWISRQMLQGETTSTTCKAKSAQGRGGCT